MLVTTSEPYEASTAYQSAGRIVRAALALPDDLGPEKLGELLETAVNDARAVADVLERRAALAATDPAQCAAILADLGALHENQLEDLDSARQAYEQAMIWRRPPGTCNRPRSFSCLGDTGPVPIPSKWARL